MYLRRKPSVERKPFVPVSLEDPVRKRRRERADFIGKSIENTLLLAWIMAPLVGVGYAQVDTLAERRKLMAELRQRASMPFLYTEKGKKSIEWIQEVAKGERVMPMNMAEFKLKIEGNIGGISEEEMQKAVTVFRKRIEEFRANLTQADEQGTLRSIIATWGHYEADQSYVTDLLMDRGGNCEARAVYLCGAVEAIHPEWKNRLQFETLWGEDDNGNVVPHIRCVIRDDENGGYWIGERGQRNWKGFQLLVLAIRWMESREQGRGRHRNSLPARTFSRLVYCLMRCHLSEHRRQKTVVYIYRRRKRTP